MRMTLLEIVQNILNKTSGDEVNSIGDTVESYQTALEVKATYYSMLDDIQWPFQYNLIRLESSADINRPTHMIVPQAVDNFKWIKYKSGDNTNTVYNTICYVSPEDFIDLLSNQAADQTIEVEDYSGVTLNVGNAQDPKYYTMFDNEHVVFDSYDADVDTILQTSKVIAMGQTIPDFSLEDTYVPEIPDKYFPLLLAESAAACFFYQKQTQSPVDERRARRSLNRHQNALNRSLEADQSVPDFGR